MEAVPETERLFWLVLLWCLWEDWKVGLEQMGQICVRSD